MKKNNIPLNEKEKKNKVAGFCASLVTLAVLALLAAAVDHSFANAQRLEASGQEEADEEEEAVLDTKTATILCAGDNMLGDTLLHAGMGDNSWDYTPYYTALADKIDAVDLAIVQQPQILTTDHDMVSGSEPYAMPTEVGDALVSAGFDVIAQASGNSDAYGADMITQTVNFWRYSYPDTVALGLHDTEEDSNTVHVREVNGIRIALLDYTCGSNYDNLTEEQSFMVDSLNQSKVAAQVKTAKENSDLVIVLTQWGKINNAMPTEYEKEWAQYLLGLGVDVLVGAHPHLLQPYEVLSDDEGHQMLVYYSLGDLVTDDISASRLLGGLAEFTVEVTTTESGTQTQITAYTLTPTVMHDRGEEALYRVMELSAYSNEMALQHDIYNTNPDITFTTATLKELYDTIIGLEVTPTADTSLLDMTFHADGSMTDSEGNRITEADLAEQYPYDESTTLKSLNQIFMKNSSPGMEQNETEYE